MQLARLSVVTCSFLVSLHAQDYASLQYLYYDESDDRITVSSPAFEINKDFGRDYTLNFRGSYDAVSGASPTYYDSASGASTQRRPKNVADLGRGPASKEDVKYGNVNFYERRNALGAELTQRLDESRDEIRYGFDWSLEFDLYVYEGALEYMHYMDASKNSALSLGLSYARHANLVQCTDYSGGEYSNGCKLNPDARSGSSQQIDSNHYNAEVTYMQLLDESSVFEATLYYLKEDGYLTNTYKNVVRNYNTSPIVVNENRPEWRNGGGVTLDYALSIGPKSAFKLHYRYYMDDWQVHSHTPEVKLLYQAVNGVRIDVGYRYYYQSGAFFYNGRRDYFTNEKYASSDDRLSEFNAFEPSVGLVYDYSRDISLNASYSYYSQSTSLRANYLITGVKYRF